MKNALRVGRVAGIGIYLHWTFAVLIAGLFAFYLAQGHPVGGALAGVGIILVVFGCVVLHELGHALTARYFGVGTRDITLYPIGGVARLQRLPSEPIKEFWIAIAGPAVNLVIAAALALGIAATGGSLRPSLLALPGADLLRTLLWLNLLVVGFNMLPAFPMDGGRVLRALLATRIPYARATEIAANIGQGMAILFGLVGLVVFNPILLFIALFVYLGAQQESKQAALRAIGEGVSVREAMMTRFTTLRPDDTLSAAITELLAGSEHDFPVVEGGRVLGVLTRADLLRALAAEGAGARVADVMRPNCLSVEDEEMLDAAFLQMQEAGCTTAPVVRRGAVIGVLTLENVGELLMVHTALQKSGGARA